jgi:hypothetical protein
MGLDDNTPTDRGAPVRPFLRHAAVLLERDDPIDAAYVQLHTPALVKSLASQMALLLSPLTGVSPSLSSLNDAGPPIPLTAPQRPALRLLPHARPRHATVMDDDDDDGAPTQIHERPSLLQRLGSQLW